MTSKRFILGMIVLCATLALGLAIRTIAMSGSPSGPERLISRPDDIMGTDCALTAVAPHGKQQMAVRGLKSAERVLRQIEAHMSTYIKLTELSRLNDANAGEAMDLSPDTMAVLRLARQLNGETAGAFDVTCLPLFHLWADAGKANRLPTAAELAATKAKCGWDKWKLLDHGAVKRVDGAGLGLGGVAKGWSIDRALEAIKAAGCTGAMVDVGGDIRCFGTPGHPGGWGVAVRDPFHPNEEKLLGLLEIREGSVCTSGNYLRFSVIDGKHYSHIVDPRTGKPVDFAPSVTVVAATAAVADGWATALSVLGPDGFKLLKPDSHIEALIVEGGPTDYRIYQTPGFAKLLKEPIPLSAAEAKAKADANAATQPGSAPASPVTFGTQ